MSIAQQKHHLTLIETGTITSLTINLALTSTLVAVAANTQSTTNTAPPALSR